jgi:hypothetical protein
MTDTKYQEAERAAERLSELDDETMFETLGIRIEDVKNKGGWQRVQMYDAAFEQNASDLLSMKDVREIGHRWWRNLEPEIMKLICDTDNADMKKIASGKTIPQVAAGLATAAVVSALAPPPGLLLQPQSSPRKWLSQGWMRRARSGARTWIGAPANQADRLRPASA